MTLPILDYRDAEAFYLQTLELAKAYAPEWSDYWTSTPPTEEAVGLDPGLVLLKLFSHLAAYTAKIENQIPLQRRLAFFQFMNMQLRPPIAAQANLQFFLESGQAPVLVPADTAVVLTSDENLRFQTSQDLTVLPARISAALAIIPGQDEYIDAMPVLLADKDRAAVATGVPIFLARQAEDQTTQPLGHWFLLGDATLFKPDPALQSISLSFTGKQLYPEYFGQWFDGNLTPLTAQVKGSDDALQLQVDLSSMPQAAALTLSQVQQELYSAANPGADFTPLSEVAQTAQADDTPQYWLLVQPLPNVKVLKSLEAQLPVITGLQCSFFGKEIQPQAAATNQYLLDISNGGYPFGQTPQTNDAFYLQADNVFGKTGATVKLLFQLTTVKVKFPVQLYWQFWDGKAWQSFNATTTQISQYQFEDTTNNLQENNPDGETYISFQCPAMQETSIAGTKGLWIRAWIANGGYGVPGSLTATSVDDTIDAVPDNILSDAQKESLSKYLNKSNVNFSYTFTNTAYYPPYIQQVQISYSYSALPSNFWCYNAFQLSRFLFSPFKPVNDVLSTFYFSFAVEDFATYSLGQKLVLFFYLQQEQAHQAGKLQWEYNDGQQWQALAVDDGTYGLSRSGLVSISVPAAMLPAYLFSQSAFWFRIINPCVERTIRIFGIYPNCVAASNVTSVVKEVLGSSNGQQFQSFTLNYTPVLPNLQLYVIETAGLELAADLTGDDLTAQLAAQSSDLFGEEITSAGASSGTGVATSSSSSSSTTLEDAARLDAAQIRIGADEQLFTWRMVENFTFSGPTDRVFTLDYQNGLVTFGDGYNGKIPPVGHNNVIAAYYEYTQGIVGNVAASSINLLRPGITNISAVNNPAPAQGGVGGDTLKNLNQTSPDLIRAGGLAVQMQDLTALAALASQQVARANAVLQEDRSIKIALLAISKDPVPYTTPALLNQVQAYVRQSSLAALAPRISTCAPDFVPIAVSAQLLVKIAPDQLNALQANLVSALQQYFQPVFGGPQQKGQQPGWAFGQTVQAFAVSVFLRQQANVQLVLSMNLNGVQNGDVALLPQQLPVAGSITLYLSLEG